MNLSNPRGLPVPGTDDLARSEKLKKRIRRAIDDSSGVLEFSRFMELALYSPGEGYYVSGLRKFGEFGDFVTAPELGQVYGQCLARQIAQTLDGLNGGEILEVGAGTGVLAAQLLRSLSDQDTLPQRYGILEISADLKQRQYELLSQQVPNCMDRIVWLTEVPAEFTGAIVANEVVDALPVDRFCIQQGELLGLGVAWENGGFVDAMYAVEGSRWDAVRELGLADGYLSEVGFQRRAWMRTLSERLRAGVIIVTDYGFPSREYYHPQRSGGTLMCHYRHRAHANPFLYVGLQDITAHVDFTGLAQCAFDSGLSVLGYTTQASFLLSLGVLDLVGPAMQENTVDAIKIGQEIKKLTLPSDMGELFKVLAVGKGLKQPLLGFANADRRGRL